MNVLTKQIVLGIITVFIFAVALYSSIELALVWTMFVTFWAFNAVLIQPELFGRQGKSGVYVIIPK